MKLPRTCLMLVGLLVAVCQMNLGAEELLDPPKAPPLDKIVPLDFKPDMKAALAGVRGKEHIGLGNISGKKLNGYKGWQPYWIYKSADGTLPNDALIKGDVLLAVNGKAAQANVKKQIDQAMRKPEACFWITRWRPKTVIGGRRGEVQTGINEGTVERFFIDQGKKMYDLRKTRAPGFTRDWRLGPLGANGWCFQRTTRHGGTRNARQMVITVVDKDGPSFGKLQLRDVIVGVDGKDFTRDVRRALAEAINEAEKEGKLNLKVWRLDKAIDVQIDLPVLGNFSKTAPFNCSKTDKIIDNAVAYIKANAETLLKYHGDEGHIGWTNYLDGLGLMATGRKDVMPLVKKLAHDAILPEGKKLNIQTHVGMMCWRWSYRTLFLCEYYLLTKDKAVLPTIEEYATKLSMGQSGAGTWGHTYAAWANAGHYHGPLGGYGAINQQGLTIMMALPLAVKCGIRNNEVLDAVKRGENFFSFFINKGTIPYGDHGPSYHTYDDNGKSGSAAIVFDLLGNRKGSAFFSEMILGQTPSGRDEGHTGHYWSHLWGGIGAARGGDNALQAYMKEMRPFFTLERQPDGSLRYQDNVGEQAYKKDAKLNHSATGARLLQLCYPRRVLYITGKETPKDNPLTEERIKEVLEVGRLYCDKEARAKLNEADILKLLKGKLPPTRTIGVTAMSEKQINCVDKLIAMLESDDKHAQYGAAEALRSNGYASEKAVKALVKRMETSTDLTFLTYAVKAFTSWDTRRGLLAVAKPAIPVILKMAARDYADDPRGVLRFVIGEALFYGGRANPARGIIRHHGLEDAHRSLLLPAAKKLLANENGRARNITTQWVYPALTEEERKELWPNIYQASRHIAPSGIMFASGARTGGLKLMAKHNIKEGLALAVWYVRYQKGHGAWGRIPPMLEVIESYGAHAKEFIPELKSHSDYYKRIERRKDLVKRPDHPASRIQKLIDTLEKLPDEPKKPLVSVGKDLKAMNIEYPPKPIVVSDKAK